MKRFDYFVLLCAAVAAVPMMSGCDKVGGDSGKEIDPNAYPEAPGMECVTIANVVWAPVNCGYNAEKYKYGKLYQWGRKDGCGYYDGLAYLEDIIQETSASTYPIEASAEDASVFYCSSNASGSWDWLSPKDNTRWDLSGGQSDIHTPVKSSYDPCPNGWRVPTYAELYALVGENKNPSIEVLGGQNGVYFNGTAACSAGTEGAKLFLPLAGNRCFNDGKCDGRGSKGYYWSSSAASDSASALDIFEFEGKANLRSFIRSNAYSVRCVKE